MKIIIVGAGISGLSLAYFLQQKGFDILVLERDDKFDSERQGFSLTMQNKTEKIFKEYGLLDEIKSLGCPANKQIFYIHSGSTLYENYNNDKDRFNYPLPRQELRKVFFNKLKPGTVEFGIKITNIKLVDDVTILVSDSKEYIADYVIACDGINSICRKTFLPSVVTSDLFLCNVYGITDLTQVQEETKEIFNKSEIQVLDGKHRFFSKPFNSDKQMWELTWPIDDTIFIELYEKYNANQDVRAEALEACKDVVNSWTNLPWLQNFMSVTKTEDVIVHPLFDLDPTNIDVSKIPSTIILIGDALHAMSPYIGLGANESLYDSYELAKLFTTGINCDKLKDFYESMIMRTRKSVLRSRDNTKFYHTVDAIDKEKLWKFKNW